jgi:chitodextrinase
LPDDATPVAGSYEVLQKGESPIANLAKDFFWQRMWGYITPTVSGDYVFKIEGTDVATSGYLSPSADPSKKVQITNSETSQTTSDAQFLEAGKTYYWMAKNADIVNTNEFTVKIAKPDQGFEFLQGDLSSPIFDTIKPTPPKNLRTVTRGVTDLLVQWDAAIDKNLLGYYVYVNGIPVIDIVNGNSYLITGLQSQRTYSVVVRAFDIYENGSDPTNTITVTTYPIDNNPPSTPTNVALLKAYDLGLQLKWDASTDAETEIRGYNLYFEGNTTPINKEIINNTNYLITGLSDKTPYRILVEAVDAGNNKSAKSAAITASTEEFMPYRTVKVNWSTINIRLATEATITLDLSKRVFEGQKIKSAPLSLKGALSWK